MKVSIVDSVGRQSNVAHMLSGDSYVISFLNGHKIRMDLSGDDHLTVTIDTKGLMPSLTERFPDEELIEDVIGHTPQPIWELLAPETQKPD